MSVGNSQNQKKGDQYVVDGAIFKCQYGSAPSQIAAQGQKVMAQGKPIASDKDTTFKVASSPFISCTQNPNKQASICQYANGVWVPNSTVKQGKQNAITESSKMKCPIFGGEISCVFSGQTQGVSAADFNNVEMEMLSNFPFALVVTIPSFGKEKKKAAAVYHVSVSKNTVRPGEMVTLHALDKKKNELTIYDRVNWALSTTKEVEADNANKVYGGTYLDRLVIFKHMSTPFDIKLREPGKYIIEGGSDGMLDNGYYRIDSNKPLVKNNIIPRDKDCAATVEVLEHNRILDLTIGGDQYKEKSREAEPKTVEYDFIQNFGQNKTPVDKISIANQSKLANLTPRQQFISAKDGAYSSQTIAKSNGPTHYAEVERYVHNISDELDIIVRTVFPLEKNEHLYFVVNGFVDPINYNFRFKSQNGTEYHYVSKMSKFVRHLDIEVFLAETNANGFLNIGNTIYKFLPKVGELGIVDSKVIKIRLIEGIASPSILLTGTGKEAPTMFRPGTTVKLSVCPNEDKNIDLSKARWVIEEVTAKALKGSKVKTEKIHEVLKGHNCLFRFDKEGDYSITLSLSECDVRLDKASETYQKTLSVQYNKPISLDINREYFYTGFCYYSVDVKFSYGSYDQVLDSKDNDGTVVTYTCKFSNVVTKAEKVMALNGGVIDGLCFGHIDAGIYDVSLGRNGVYGEKSKIKVVNPEVERWQFVDENGNKINRVGYDEKFFLEISIPAWKDLSELENIRKLLLQKVGLYLWDDLLATPIQISSVRQAKFDNNGYVNAEVCIPYPDPRVSEQIIQLKGRSHISISASLTNPPFPNPRSSNILNLKEKARQYGHWVCTNSRNVSVSSLILTTEQEVSGFFAGKSGNPQKSVMKYGDSVYIIINTHNCKAVQDKISVKLFENNTVGDDDDQIGEEYTNLEFNNGKAKIDISGNFTDESQHGDNPNPRLFYFKVYLDGKAVYTYPLTPADIYADKTKFFESPVDIQDASYAKSTPDDVFDMDVEKEVEALSITKETDADDVEKSKKERFGSYLWQLKIGKDKEIERLNRSLTMMAPVVVGEELRQGEKSLGDYRCPRCNEEAEDLKKRLKEMFCGAKDGDISIIAETYCKYQRLLHMDSCWIKAHFFAQAAVESTHLTEFTERLNYTTKKRLHEVFDSSVFKQKGTKKVEQKLNEIFDETRTSTKEDRKKKIAMLIYGERPKDLGNDTEEDGWTYRGRGLVQITGKAAYEKVGKILLCLGLDKDGIECDLVNNPDLVASDLRLATVASMAFFRYKGCNMYNLCNGNENTYLVSNAVGGFDKPKKQTAFDGKYVKDGVTKQKENCAKEVFDVEHCDWKKIKFTGVVPSYHTFSNGRVEKHIPKGCDENTVDHYEFYYHKEDGSCVKICERTIVREGLFKMNIPTGGRVPTDEEIKKNGIETWKYPKPVLEPGENDHIDGDTIYFMPNGDKIVTGKEGVKKYSKSGDETFELVKIDEGREDGIFEFNKNGVNLYYQIDKTQTVRFYSDPNTFAILIGLLAELGSNPDYEIKFRGTGNAEIHGTGYPSRTHVNGMSLDFCYSKDKDEDVKLAKDMALLNAAYKFCCRTMYVGHKEEHKGKRLDLAQEMDNHDSHIHLGPFNKAINKPKIIKED